MATVENNNIAFFDNLVGGDYEVTVENAYGCGLMLDVSLQTCGVLPLNETITPSYCNQNNGSITLNIEDNSNLTFLWGNGVTTQNRTDLGAGGYDLTVTNTAEEGCSYVRYFEVAEIETFFQVSLLEFNHPTEPEAGNGKIILEAIPSTGTYDYQWSDGGVGNSRTNLSLGTYTVTVTDQEGCLMVQTYTLESCTTYGEPIVTEEGETIYPIENTYPIFDIETLGGLILPARDQITCSVLLQEGNAAFSPNFPSYYAIEWYLDGILVGTGQTVSFDKNTYTQSPNATITVQVTNGCTEIEAVQSLLQCGAENDHTAAFFVVDQDKPCAGFSDGSITFGFQNPGLGCDIVVSLDGIIELPYTENGDFITTTVGGLAPSQLHEVTISFEDCFCSFSFEFELEAESLTSENSEFIPGEDDELGVCESNLFYDGNFISSTQSTAEAAWFESAGSGFTACKTPILCNGEEVGEKKFNKTCGNAFEYFLTITAAEGSGIYPPGYTDAILDFFNTTIGVGELCHKICWCEGSLRFVGSWPIVPGAPVTTQGVVTNSSGCTRVFCSLPFGLQYHYDVCPSDIDFPNVDPDIFSCIPRKVNIYKMHLDRPYLINDYENYAGSFVDNFVEENYQNPEAKCASITFCLPDFTYITDDLQEIAPYCGTALPAPLMISENQSLESICDSYYDPISNSETVVCPDEQLCENCFGVVVFAHPDCEEIDCLTSDGDVSLRVMNNSNEREELLNFGISKSSEAINPKGLVQKAATMLFDNYIPTSNYTLKDSISHVEFMVEDWENEHVIYVEQQTEHQSYRIVLDADNTMWIKNLTADDGLNIQHFSSTNDEILIGGTFSGLLSYNDVSIANHSSSAFILRLDNQGNLSSQLIIEHIDPAHEIVFSESRNGTVIIGGRYANNSLMVNGNSWNMSHLNACFFMKVDADNQATLISDIDIDASFSLKDVNFSFDKSRISFVTYGSGTITWNGNSLISENTPHLVLINQYMDGSINWVQLIDADNLNIDKLDMTFGKVNNTFVGLTFSNELNLLDETINSEGQEDIALLHLTAGGHKIWVKQYGNQDNETVSQLLYDNMVIYFGGEFDGTSSTRRIGKYNFLNPYNSSAAKSYISYLLDEYCADSLYLTNSVNSDNIYQAKEAIVTTSNMLPNTNVSLKAGDQIHFQPGFHAQAESYVHATIAAAEDCDDSQNYQTEEVSYRQEEAVPPSPTKASLRCYPNPFQQSTTIEYQVPETAVVDIAIYGMRGETIAQLSTNEILTAGTYQIDYPALGLTTGIYYVVCRVGQDLLTEKLVVIGR